MSKKKDRWFVKNLIKAVVFVAVLLLTVQIALNIGTRHNREIEVPDFTGMMLSEAEHLAAAENVRLDVTDSVFFKRLARGAVFSQNPVAGSRVKKGRRILVTINATSTKTVEMPNLVGYSLRQAKTEILSKGLKVGRLTYRDDIATNNVLEQRIGTRVIKPGEKVEVESPVNLVLGCDPNNSMTFIPNLTGYTYEVAIDNITDGSLNVGKIKYDETVQTYTDSLEAMVYAQSPEPGNEYPYPLGTQVNISLTMSQSKVAARKKADEQ